MLVRSAGIVLCLAFLTACGPNERAEKMVDEILDVMRSIPKILDSVKDSATAKAAEDQVEALTRRMEDLAVKNRDLKVRTAEKERLEKRIRDETGAITADMMRAHEALEKRAPLQVRRIEEALAKFQERVQKAAKL